MTPLLKQLAAELIEAASKEKKDSVKDYVIAVNGKVVPCKMTKAEYEGEVKRLATSGAKIELFTFAGDLSTNLDVALAPKVVAETTTDEVAGE